MSTPRSVRFDDTTVDKLAVYASRHPGMSSSSAAALLVEEGLRMDAHPGIVFRQGLFGRRAGLAAGPDVWEIIRAVKSTREAEQDLGAEEVLQVIVENTDLSLAQLRVALGYHSEYPNEIDRQIKDADAAEESAAETLAHTARLLDR